MKPTKRAIADGESASGSVNVISRLGDIVFRPMGHWSSSVHELLLYLEKADFKFSPRFLGVDSSTEKEKLTYLDGEVALRPWPSVLRSLDGLAQIAEMLKRYHELVVDFQSSKNNWHLNDRAVPKTAIIRHGDIGPWNMVWKGDQLVGLIDWDFAEPGTILEDLAQIAWHCIPLKPAKRVANVGELDENQKERFEHFCRIYGVSTKDVLEVLPVIHDQELNRMRTHGVKGIQPWSSFLERGDLNVVTEDAEWLKLEKRNLLI